MILDLLTDEVRRNFPKPFTNSIVEYKYNLHCSEAFAMTLMKSLLQIGFQIPAYHIGDEVKEITVEAIQNKEVRFTKYQIPNLGIITVFTDMDQGYKIEEDGQ